MAHHHAAFPFCRHAVALACCALVPAVHAQSEPAALPPVVVTSSSPAPAAPLTGFGAVPLAQLPMQTTVIDRDRLDALQARHLADVFALEASASDAYNSPGYWDYTMLRGYVLEQRYNYRREGLPITAETVIPLANKERIEILKGTSGIQAGTSSPGGLVNYVVKRPVAGPLRTGSLSVGDRGSVGAGVDLGGRAGADGAFGYRINLAYESSRPEIERVDHAETSLAAFAAEWRLAGTALLEAEVEWSHQVGPSLPGHSLTGDRLPTVRRPVNLNDQAWSQPNKFGALTGTLRYAQDVAPGWRWTTTLGLQRLKTDDRLAYAFGYQCGVEGAADLCDRYGPDGGYDVYDYRSEDERRRVDVAQTAVQGAFATGTVKHTVNVGLQASRRSVDTPTYTYNYAGELNIDGSLEVPPSPEALTPGLRQRERNVELFLTDAIDWGHGFGTWAGLRTTRLEREANDDPSYEDTVTTPWLAGSYRWRPEQQVYVSWGEGTESFSVPGRAGTSPYTEAGRVLLGRSRQWELGTKGSQGRASWGLAAFDIDRPALLDAAPTYRFDGSARHRGVDGEVAYGIGPWQLTGGAMWLRARREGSLDPALNGRRPVNVPEHTVKAQVNYRVAQASGLDLQARIVHEGRRAVLPDNSIELPSWTRTDLGARYSHKVDGAALTWTLGVFNVFDRQAWKESPTQFGHVYLFPLEARTVRLTLLAEL